MKVIWSARRGTVHRYDNDASLEQDNVDAIKREDRRTEEIYLTFPEEHLFKWLYGKNTLQEDPKHRLRFCQRCFPGLQERYQSTAVAGSAEGV